MLMADETSNVWSSDAAVPAVDDAPDLFLDLDDFWEIMGENPNASQDSPEDLSLNNVQQGSVNIDGEPSSGAEFSGSFDFSLSYHSEASDSRIGVAASSSDSAGNSIMFDSVKLESSSNFGSPVNSFSGSLNDWMPASGQSHFRIDGNNVHQNVNSSSQEDSRGTQFGNNTGMFSFDSDEANHVIDNRQTSDSSHVKRENEFQFRHLDGVTLSEYMSHNSMMTEDKPKVPIAPNKEDPSMMRTDVSSYGASHSPFSGLYFMSKDNPSNAASLGQYAPYSFNCESFSENDDKRVDMKEHRGTLEAPKLGNCGVIDLNVHYDGGSDPSRSGLPFALSNGMFHANQNFYVEKEINDKLCSSQVITSQFSEKVDRVTSVKACGVVDELSTNEGCISNTNFMASLKEEKNDIFHDSRRPSQHPDIFSQVARDRCLDVQAAERAFSLPSASVKQQLLCAEVKREGSSIPPKNITHFSKSHQVIQKLSVAQRYSVDDDDDDDADLCILEDISDPACRSLSTSNGKSLVVSQHSTFSKPYSSMAVGHVRHKANDERFVFRAALQVLSQPKAEELPPDGLLAVPLLRHQRIALSWMVKKEKYGDPCTGGILADDQGLGKTVSTIALILKERSPTSAVSTAAIKQREAETLNLDEDEDGDSDSSQANSSFAKGGDTSVQTRGRLAAGTLIVCPTSVLRQWNDELHNKVTKQANLSVLVYHGSSRTKDSSELAKYDVVLTTYSIVSMEVPKQPLVDEDDDETGERRGDSARLSSSKKRKYPPSSSKRSLKGKKGMDGELLESIPAPLAKVGWFRVVLDEAQSIKNHRTQVARACWGLRAKRRWCLSGTPIQNAVDDLYSYFRFLRFDPYLKYKSFCSTIKVPIQRNPANGYKKLQAVLKTIMLRRTKGTFLDGEPIINLPPKTIELRKVDFTEEERDFYCRLEADSRAQFAEYAAAGTVKQNYVNILLMLLRLRQACDHPLLIRGYKSKSMERSSVEMAKKLPREKQMCLLNCLQASQAICGICSDSPEDAVVTVCGHVFCNQCICENLTGDDRQCPTTNCKVQLSTSSIFSVPTLANCLSDQPSLESTDSSDGEVAETSDPFTPGYESSKIKAALQVLQSLPKPRKCDTSSSLIIKDEATSTKKLPHFSLVGENKNINETKITEGPGCSSDITVVAGEKAIVFSQWTRMLDLLEDGLKNSSLQYRRLDGTMSVVARDKAVKDFNTLPEVSVMIMSLKAASLGLNMVAACHVLLLDLWWNPTTEDQAIDRAHRIGQTRPVTVVRLTVKDTVEDRILALQQKKREMVASAFGEDENGSRQTRLTVEDLKYLFGDMPR